MDLTEEERQKIAAEEKYRAEVRQNIGKTPWWKPKGIIAWIFTIGLISLLASFFLPLVIAVIITIIIWKLNIDKKYKIAVSGVAIITGLLLYPYYSASFFKEGIKTGNGQEQVGISKQVQVPKKTTIPTDKEIQVKKVFNVKELIGKRYADLDSILGPAKSFGEPNGTMTGILYWDKGDVHAETNYYNLQDPVQMMGFTFKQGISFKDYNDAFKIVGLDPIDSPPDKTTTFQKKWYNVQGVYEVIFTSGIDGNQAITVLFYCNPDRLGICKFD